MFDDTGRGGILRAWAMPFSDHSRTSRGVRRRLHDDHSRLRIAE